jgi:hypothetical protein
VAIEMPVKGKPGRLNIVHTSKRILAGIDGGEGIAMAGGVITRPQMYADGSR